MKLTLFLFALWALMPLRTLVCGHAQEPASTLVHTRNEFSFTVDAPFEQVVPLFGAHEERKWADGWDPQFVYPTPAHDQQGEVFKVAHGHHSSVWINTALDLTAGHIQYAYVLNDAMVTLIDIHADPARPAEDWGHRCLRTHGTDSRGERTRAALRQGRRERR